MKIKHLSILIMVIYISNHGCFSQDAERKGRFFFNFGPEYRITPFYSANQLSPKAFYTNIDRQNSGIALNLGIDFYLSNKLSVGFQNSFRNALITTGSNGINEISEGVSASKKGIIIGYHFNINYRFNLFKKGDFIVHAGISLLNRNTDFSITETLNDQNGVNVGLITTQVDYSYNANKVAIGYGNGRSKVLLGMYVSGNSGYFEQTSTIFVPFLNYSFDFAKL